MNILAIDGGGIRGIIPARVLQYVEEQTGKQIYELFDLIVGTSTGAILTAGLTLPAHKVSAQGIARNLNAYDSAAMIGLFKSMGPDIFPRKWWHMYGLTRVASKCKFPAEGIEASLQKAFGVETSIADALTEVLITSYDMRLEFWFAFSRAGARRALKSAVDKPQSVQEIVSYQNRLWVACRASSAAPTFFPPFRYPSTTQGKYQILIDGGVFANNPSAVAFNVLARHLKGQAIPQSINMLSLGTGFAEKREKYNTISELRTGWWGLRIPSVMMQSSTSLSTGIARNGLKLICKDSKYLRLDCSIESPDYTGPSRYHRFGNAVGIANGDMDEASEQNMRRLEELGETIVKVKQVEIDRFCKRLMKKFDSAPTPTPSP